MSIQNVRREILKTAKAAGKITLKHYAGKVKVSLKKDGSPVTEADLEANLYIRQALKRSFPQIPYLSEESQIPDFKERSRWKTYWLVDPLDGTKEFLDQNGEFTVNIALIHNQTPVAGVVYAPVLDTIYAADTLRGSWTMKRSRRAQKLPVRSKTAAKQWVIVESRRHGVEPRKNGASSTLGPDFRIEPMGSSLKFCRIAEGTAHLYPRNGPTYEWDTAAGDCVYRLTKGCEFVKSPLSYQNENLKNGPFIIGQKRAVQLYVKRSS